MSLYPGCLRTETTAEQPAGPVLDLDASQSRSVVTVGVYRAEPVHCPPRRPHARRGGAGGGGEGKNNPTNTKGGSRREGGKFGWQPGADLLGVGFVDRPWPWTPWDVATAAKEKLRNGSEDSCSTPSTAVPPRRRSQSPPAVNAFQTVGLAGAGSVPLTREPAFAPATSLSSLPPYPSLHPTKPSPFSWTNSRTPAKMAQAGFSLATRVKARPVLRWHSCNKATALTLPVVQWHHDAPDPAWSLFDLWYRDGPRGPVGARGSSRHPLPLVPC